MNFAMDEDVLELVDAVGDFFDRRGDGRLIAEATVRSAPRDRLRWSELCAMGLPALRLPTPEGVGAGLLEATAVTERIGAILLPEPAAATFVLADAWSRHSEGAELLAAMCSGDRIVTLCGLDTVEMSPEGLISGHLRVPDDDITESVAVLAHDAYTGGSAIVIVDKADLLPVVGRTETDPTRPTALIQLDCVEPAEALRLTVPAADKIRHEFALLTVAELVGGMQHVLTSTVAHVKQREQFGRPIGGFQAVKHRLATMYATTEQARAAVQFAAIELSSNTKDAAASLGSVVRWVPRNAIDVCEDAIHLHGAMGYSWEVDVHLYLRRALAVRELLGDGFGEGSDDLRLARAV